MAVSKVGKILARSQSLKPQVDSLRNQASVDDFKQWQLLLRQTLRVFDERRL
ncbi:hypothetical protein D3C84_1235500 [compost metagenome]